MCGADEAACLDRSEAKVRMKLRNDSNTIEHETARGREEAAKSLISGCCMEGETADLLVRSGAQKTYLSY
jgi:hypothetical protein